MRISCCMIVKNEEEMLKSTLNSIEGIFDELIIVDTGSVDSTVSIAREFTEKVYDFKWVDDFSAARNFSISKAKNDFVFILDADEKITYSDKDSLDRFQPLENDILRVMRRNQLENGQIYLEKIRRLFNKRVYHFEGIIHEQVVPINGEYGRIVDTDVTMDHTGYMNEVLNRTKKIDRNINLLKISLEKSNKDSYLHYQLGKSYSLKKELPKARESFEKSLEFLDNTSYEYVQDLLVSYGYNLLNMNLFSEALSLERFNNDFNDKVDYIFLMGIVYMNNSKFDKAVENYKKCLSCKDGSIEGINSYMPCYNIGIIYECLGYKEEAVSWYKKCNDYLPAEQRLNALAHK